MSSSGSILITGASTGIGLACAKRLDELGYRVFAGVRKQEDYERLTGEGSARLQPIMIDVTDAAQTAAAVAEIADTVRDEGLAGLINNAGIAVAGPLEFVSDDRLRWQFDVNVFGLMRVTRLCLPLLRIRPGRLVNIGSIAGRSAVPLVGAYGASKFAVEGLSDALRVELKPWNIKVIVIEPGAIMTPIWERSGKEAEEARNEMPKEGLELYGNLMQALQNMVLNIQETATPPERVADAAAHAMTARSPKPRYIVGRDAKLRMWLERLPTSWRDALIFKRISGG